ncbi:hypothetical protein [Arthrobacter mangrovi]|uniref:HTH marR-type domain-containing protein n=1 Tax=Arthrobacter mangrovi TaxID=2966350 RepID=A0ABQ5MY14_9MICC|nr:hypothetical protein [Arthrobacter mangrovi]GLB68725.1 hypothetical protein AHIS1636_31670 [Arthrobacter mangrovi]
MGKTLSRLEEHGHITRMPNQVDRRSHRVAVSDLGRAVLVQARELERTVVPGGEGQAEGMRDRLTVVIRRLGADCWGWRTPEMRTRRGNQPPVLDGEDSRFILPVRLHHPAGSIAGAREP